MLCLAHVSEKACREKQSQLPSGTPADLRGCGTLLLLLGYLLWILMVSLITFFDLTRSTSPPCPLGLVPIPAGQASQRSGGGQG